jgi:hypothetical protein
VAIVAAAFVLVVVALGLAALWPPVWAPERWRHWTRPLRRRVRPRHYGHFR